MTMMRASSQSQKIEGLTKEFPEAVVQLDRELEAAPQNAELWFQRAALLGEERLMRDALDSLSRAIALDPFCGIYYRWRGHRHLNLAEIPEASADLTVASRLIPENWDVWYHLGLTHVLLGNYELAELAYRKCAFVTSERASNCIPLANWSYLALMHQGKTEQTQQVLRGIPDDMTTQDYNSGYLEMINFYKGRLSESDMLDIRPDLDESARKERIFDVCTHAFGMANHFYTTGNKKRYAELIDYILELGQEAAWNCFAFAGAYYTKTYRNM